MQLLLRLMAVLLVLTTGGVLQTLAFASDEHAECEEEGAACTDCFADCALCLCCPLRAAPVSVEVEVPESVSLIASVPSRVDDPALSSVGSDIFQPPKA